jgi:hypothetical protein
MFDVIVDVLHRKATIVAFTSPSVNRISDYFYQRAYW